MEQNLTTLAGSVRREVLDRSHRAGVGHIGSSLSVVEILAAVYGAVMGPQEGAERDRFVLSKGHSALALYAVLDLTGRLPEGFEGYCIGETPFGVHPELEVPGVDFATGSLGQGVSMATGAALAARLQGSPRRVFALVSDGELNEGVVWEAVAFAGHHRLGALQVIVDLNGQQAFGYTGDVLDPGDLPARFGALGWDATEVDGHDADQVAGALAERGERPHAVIAHTTFGKGVDFMESLIPWHYLPMTEEQYAAACRQVGGAHAP